MSSAIVKGNFTGQPDGRFPVDVETFQQLQDYIDSVASVLKELFVGATGVNGYIVSGCNLNAEGTRREAGWLLLKNEGLVYYEGGDGTSVFSVVDNTIDVVVGGVTYAAYTKRVAVNGDSGNGNEHFWYTIKEMSLFGVPIGGAVMWPGNNSMVPEGWLLCDGAQYNVTDYPSLFMVIGNMYTPEGEQGKGKFNVPKLPYLLDGIGIYHAIRAK